MSEFSERPFAAGRLNGIRSFRQCPDGTLTGVHFQTPWAEDENEAEHSSGVWHKQPHQVAQLNCSCGFWAYFDLAHNPHHARGHILGIVQGSGVITVGSRGFRCEKARIVALIHQPLPELALIDSIPFAGWLIKWAIGKYAGQSRVMTREPSIVPRAVRHRYPGVPIYTSVDAALRDFPLTVPQRPLPSRPETAA